MDALFVNELNKGLKTKLLGRQAVVLDTVDSTNTEVRRMIELGAAEGVTVVADRQTGGRGRRGRRWVSESGCGLWMSFAIKALFPPTEIQQITLAAGVAVCEAVEGMSGSVVNPVIKWPNDVLLDGRKLCGILCESTEIRGERYVITGIGVNTKIPPNGWGEAEGIAISLEEAGMAVSRMSLAADILNHMEKLLDLLQSKGFASVAGEYRKRMLTPGSEVVLIEGDKRRRGKIEGLDDAGGLLVRLENGETERVISGEISLRGVGGYV